MGWVVEQDILIGAIDARKRMITKMKCSGDDVVRWSRCRNAGYGDEDVPRKGGSTDTRN